MFDTISEVASREHALTRYWSGLYAQPSCSDYVKRVLFELDGTAWSTGIESDRKRRGTSINIDVCDETTWQGQQLALVQVRECRFRPGRYSRVRKDYYLVGRNENGNVFAHPVDAKSNTPILEVLSAIWGCDLRDLSDIVRNGDVALIPVRSIPTDAQPVTGSISADMLTGADISAQSHVVTGELRVIWRASGAEVYVQRAGKIEHSKGQHPTARVKLGWWRVQVAARGNVWGFSRPTAD